MYSLSCHMILRFEIFDTIEEFFLEVVWVCCIRVKSVTIWVWCFFLMFTYLRMRTFREEVRLVGGQTDKWLLTGIELPVFISEFVIGYTLGFIRGLIPGLSCKWYILLFVLDPGYYFLSHLWPVSWILLPIGWVNISVIGV